MSERRRGLELVWLLPALIAGFLVFSGSIHGDFVYDDTRQIVRNTLIQDPSQTIEALTSDVWAAKGGGEPVSNYWRPTFVAWLIGNVRAFGLADTTGWHLGNIALHLLATGLLFALARRLGAASPVAAAIALLFAVHPVHAESVAWISGSPDLLLAVTLLAASLCVPSLARNSSPRLWSAALALYLLALGAKETAVVFPLLALVIAYSTTDAETSSRRKRGLRALLVTLPFVVLAIGSLLGRFAVLGRFAKPWPGAPDLVETLLTAPSVFLFYLLQILWPIRIGPSYSLRAVTLENLGFANFWLPLVVTLLVLAGALALARRSRTARIGLAFWLVPLAPAFALGVFHPEQLVHDRYLYLPLAGFLLLALPALAEALERFGRPALRPRVATAVLAALVALPLALQCRSASAVWTSELALWRRGVETDPTSAFNQLQLGATLEAAGSYDAARAAFDRSIALRPIPNALVGRARVAIAQERFEDAERDLRSLLSGEAGGVAPYTLYQAFEALALGFEHQQRPDRAVQALVTARRALPMYAAALTDKLAIELYRSGRKPEALRELEAHRQAARSERLPESRMVLFRLGLLYAELRRDDLARAAFRDYLDSTEGLSDPATRKTRERVSRALAKSPG